MADLTVLKFDGSRNWTNGNPNISGLATNLAHSGALMQGDAGLGQAELLGLFGNNRIGRKLASAYNAETGTFDTTTLGKRSMRRLGNMYGGRTDINVPKPTLAPKPVNDGPSIDNLVNLALTAPDIPAPTVPTSTPTLASGIGLNNYWQNRANKVFGIIGNKLASNFDLNGDGTISIDELTKVLGNISGQTDGKFGNKTIQGFINNYKLLGLSDEQVSQLKGLLSKPASSESATPVEGDAALQTLVQQSLSNLSPEEQAALVNFRGGLADKSNKSSAPVNPYLDFEDYYNKNNSAWKTNSSIWREWWRTNHNGSEDGSEAALQLYLKHGAIWDGQHGAIYNYFMTPRNSDGIYMSRPIENHKQGGKLISKNK